MVEGSNIWCRHWGANEDLMLRNRSDLLLDLMCSEEKKSRKIKCHQQTPEIPRHHLSVTLNKAQEGLGGRKSKM